MTNLVFKKHANVYVSIEACKKCGGFYRYRNGNKCVICRRNYKFKYNDRYLEFKASPLTEIEKQFAVESYSEGVTLKKICNKLMKRSCLVKEALFNAGLITEKQKQKYQKTVKA